MRPTFVLAIALLAASGCAPTRLSAPPPPIEPSSNLAAETPAPRLAALIDPLVEQVNEGRLKVSIEALVGFGTRHTLSSADTPGRGIAAARDWVADEFLNISSSCGGCLEIRRPSDTVTAPRIPTPTVVSNVIAIQRGARDPDRVIIISAHLDSRASDAMDAEIDAPGANDDASGVAAVIEAARILSRQKFDATLVYAALTGEEQGLVGGRILAAYAGAEGWRVAAVLNNDIIGNTEGLTGLVDRDHVRVFAEGVRANETEEMAQARRSTGGEVDSPARNLARFLSGVASRHVEGLEVRMIYRTDRFGRGGDQIPMLQAGIPAVRITEAVENYRRQHQNVRVENGVSYGDTIDGVDFGYLAKVTRLNVAALATLAAAPPPPANLRVEGAVSTDTTLTWTPVDGAAGYRVWWRATTEPFWTNARDVPGIESRVTLSDIVIDDWFFGVSSIGPNGAESPVQYPGPIGSFGAAPAAE